MRIHHATLAKAKKFKITLTVEDNEVVATDAKGNRLASGLQGNKVLEDAITKATGKVAKKSAQPKSRKVREASNAERNEDIAEDDEDGEEGEDEAVQIEADDAEADEEGAAEPKSVVKAKYKKLYQPNKHRNGDDLSHQISQHVSEEIDGETRVSVKKLRAFAKANECWVESYGSLRNKAGEPNTGMMRMNVANRLRAKIRRAEKDNEKFEIVWK